MIYITSLSGMKNAVMMSVLKGSSSEMTVKNIADIALLLSECKNVESAEVPTAVNDYCKTDCEFWYKRYIPRFTIN